MANKQTLSPIFVPEPRSMELAGDVYEVEANKLIVIEAEPALKLLFEAQEAQRALSEFAGGIQVRAEELPLLLLVGLTE